jgi:hypothetical protein
MGKSTMKGSQIATDAPQLLSVAGHLVEPVSPTAVSAENRLTPEEMKEINSAGTTWAFNELFLRTLIVQLWKRVDGTQMGLREIPLLKVTLIGFPYCYSSGRQYKFNGGFTLIYSQEHPPLFLKTVPNSLRRNRHQIRVFTVRKFLQTGVGIWAATSYAGFEMLEKLNETRKMSGAEGSRHMPRYADSRNNIPRIHVQYRSANLIRAVSAAAQILPTAPSL